MVPTDFKFNTIIIPALRVARENSQRYNKAFEEDTVDIGTPSSLKKGQIHLWMDHLTPSCRANKRIFMISWVTKTHMILTANTLVYQNIPIPNVCIISEAIDDH
jgi:hypothetical protein